MGRFRECEKPEFPEAPATSTHACNSLNNSTLRSLETLTATKLRGLRPESIRITALKTLSLSCDCAHCIWRSPPRHTRPWQLGDRKRCVAKPSLAVGHVNGERSKQVCKSHRIPPLTNSSILSSSATRLGPLASIARSMPSSATLPTLAFRLLQSYRLGPVMRLSIC